MIACRPPRLVPRLAGLLIALFVALPLSWLPASHALATPAAAPTTVTLSAVTLSTVTLSTVTLKLAGREVEVDVHRPAGAPRGAVILSHGFTRSRTTLGGHAAAIAEAGAIALTPDMPYTFDFRRNAQGLSELVARLLAGGTLGAPVQRVMLVGFSAGGLSSLLAASAPGVVGYVGLDPFDKVTRETGQTGAALGRDFAPGLRTEAILLRAPPSRCNAQAVAAPWAALLPGLRYDRVIEGASHCDFESPTDWMCRLACGDTDPKRQGTVRAGLLEAVERWLPR